MSIIDLAGSPAERMETKNMISEYNRKIYFRITDYEYRVLRLIAFKKGLTVSAFCRQMIGAVIAPTAVTLTDELIEKMEKEVAEETGKVLK